MHVAVQQGASENISFKKYVEYLDENNLIPARSKGWVDKIRDMGNESNHEIRINTRKDADDMLRFMGMLLSIVYEFPAEVPLAE